MMKTATKITHDQAAFILGVTRQTIYNMLERGELADVSGNALQVCIDAKQREVDLMASRLVFVTNQKSTPKGVD
jgi:hypothetical protein